MEIILLIDFLFSNIAKVILIVYLLSKTRYFKYLLLKVEQSTLEKFILITIFSIVAILGNYNGVSIGDYETNTRALGIILGGLIGGPFVGTFIGSIAGAHSLYVGGELGYAPFLVALSQGYISGHLAQRLINSPERWKFRMVGFGLETLHIFLLVAFNPPFDHHAMRIVTTIGLPMILINGAGIAVVMTFIESIYGQKAEVKTIATQHALNIASNTLTNLSDGLTKEGTMKIAENILDKADNIEAVAITSTKKVLTFKGREEDFCIESLENNMKFFNGKAELVFRKGFPQIYQTKDQIGYLLPNCSLSGAVIVPLMEFDEVIGALMFFKKDEYSITKFDEELAMGLGRLMSSKLETSRNQRQKNLLASAEINALQAQINPHFLFNALSTISYYCRKEPETARELIIHLSEYYRNNMVKSENLINVKKEIEHINSYVKIEMARFQGKLKVEYDLDPKSGCIKLPALILQPIVENALQHGLYPKKNGGTIVITARVESNNVIITVKDDGVGMDQELIKNVLVCDSSSTSLGLSNVDSRLKSIYGEEYGLKINSIVGKETKVVMTIPLRKDETNYA